jgi:hypothetical protein
MNAIASQAEHTLRNSPHPALTLSELLESVSEIVDRTLSAARLRAILEGHPDRFRILEPWRGPWRSPPGTSLDGKGRPEPWVVAVAEPDHPPDGASPAAINLRESIRWLARGVDPRSPSDVSRWYALALSERSVRQALARRPA